MSKASILVVDDEEPIRALLTRLLLLHGHTVESASDGAQALDLLSAKRYDLLIIDRNMPKMSGVDVVSAIRTSPKHKSLKILMATSTSVNKEVEAAFEAGVDGYVLKPFHLDQLVSKVDRTLKS